MRPLTLAIAITRTVTVGALVIWLLTLAAAGSAGAAVNFGDVNQIELEPVGLDYEQVPVSIVSGRFDDDSDPDIAAATGTQLRILRGAKKGGFKPLRKRALRAREDVFLQVVTASVNTDGRPDLIVLEAIVFQGGRITTLLGEGSGKFRVAGSFQEHDEQVALNAIAAGDLDGDGDSDVVAAGGDGVRIFLGDGTGGLAPGTHLRR